MARDASVLALSQDEAQIAVRRQVSSAASERTFQDAARYSQAMARAPRRQKCQPVRRSLEPLAMTGCACSVALDKRPDRKSMLTERVTYWWFQALETRKPLLGQPTLVCLRCSSMGWARKPIGISTGAVSSCSSSQHAPSYVHPARGCASRASIVYDVLRSGFCFSCAPACQALETGLCPSSHGPPRGMPWPFTRTLGYGDWAVEVGAVLVVSSAADVAVEISWESPRESLA